MTELAPADLAFAAMLLVCRLGACGMLLPGTGEAAVPMPVRLGLVLALVPLLLPALAPAMPPAPDDAAGALRLVAGELAVGAWIGLLARLVATALAMAGQLAAGFIGLSSMIAPDPAMGAQGTALSQAMGLAAAAVVLASGLYALPLRALAESYAVLPAGAPFAAEAPAQALAEGVAACFALAVQLCAPLLVLSVLAQVATGLLSRVAPQAQVFVVAAPAQTIAGLALLALLLPAILSHWGEAARAAWSALPGLG
ncbi:flagellar biosynthetic protein FliR [Falsiroseomonas sp. CW058]|uniref:flagellar biosynthetic protein FliR n=1 Tax=Falsiroseomonas sp. CW058 TaxID=3388664 RepID=UPI003D312050